jgi:hypothetical protein
VNSFPLTAALSIDRRGAFVVKRRFAALGPEAARQGVRPLVHGSETQGAQPAHHHAAPAPHEAGFSLLRLSVAQRLGIVLLALALIWSGVYWALS